MKIETRIGLYTITLEDTDLDNLEKVVANIEKVTQSLAPLRVVQPKAVRGAATKAKTKASEPTDEKVGTADEMLLWLQTDGQPRAKNWVVKHSGFSNASRLLGELTRKCEITWHECLYPRANGKLGTMKAAFLGDAKPPETTPHDDQAIMLQWIRENPGYKLKFAENNCGVTRTKAEKAVNQLLIRSEVEMRPHPKDPESFTVWAVE